MDEEELEGGPEKSPQGKRQRSTIGFPYGDLNDAQLVARTIHDRLGTSCETDQLAAQLGVDVNNGTFRMRVAAARIFGLVDVTRQRITLTDLGMRIGDEPLARVDAFLNVPLYRKLFELFRGQRLPSDRGLEAEIVRQGVSAKQADKARQAFQRSAEQAGFFEHGRDRLVAPANTNLPPVAPVSVAERDDSRSRVDGVDLDGLHPLLVGLIKTIPREGQRFTPKKQRQWLEAAKVNFALIFGSEDDPERGEEA